MTLSPHTGPRAGTGQEPTVIEAGGGGADTSAAEPAPTGYDELLQVLTDLPVIVRETRRRKGLSLRQAAEQAGCNASTLMRVERGIGDPSLSNAAGILRWAAS